MHSYNHHIGDFNNATRHLTRVERSLYRDAIDMYYDTEQPLPANDFDRLCRKLLAHSEEEKAALQYVLGEFFTLDGDVYRQVRCDKEIATYHENREKKAKAGRASAAARQQKGTGVEQACNECGTNEQLTNNHIPITNSNPPISPQVEIANRVIDALNSLAGKKFRHVDNNRKPIIARLADGFTEQDCLTVIRNRVSRWSGTEQAEYLRPETLFRPSKFESYLNDTEASHENSRNGNAGNQNTRRLSAVEQVRAARERSEATQQGPPVAVVGGDD